MAVVVLIGITAFSPLAGLKLALWFAATTLVVNLLARRLVGEDSSLGGAGKAVLLSALLPLLVLFALATHALSAGGATLDGALLVLFLGLLAASFVAAFRWTMGTSWSISALLAVAALLTSIVIWWLMRALG